jgi:DUF917 family protein
MLNAQTPTVEDTGQVRLDASNLPAFARGCALLGSGGGGDPELGLVMALTAVARYGPVEVVDLADLPAGALIMPCGMVGAPTVASERIWGGDEGALLAEIVEDLHGRPVAAYMCFEIGGVNGLLPVTWAARAGLPLVDADGMGRAFTELHRQAMHLHGVPASPVVLTDGRASLTLRTTDDARAERLARHAATSLGGVCAAALFCMPAGTAASAAIAGSVSRAVALGSHPGSAVLIEGKVVDLERAGEEGPAQGSATVRGTGADTSRELRLELQSEFLLAVEDGEVLAAVPDVIAVLESESGDPIAAETLRHGQRVTVVAVAAPDVWHSASGLALVGPRAFGYAVDHAPISEAAADVAR